MDQVRKTSPFAHPAKDGKKRCSRCLKVLPLEMFPNRAILSWKNGERVRTGKMGHDSRCRTCKSELHLEANWLRKFGITMGDYHKMYEAQDGKCYLCGEEGPEKVDNGRPRLHLDHNHTTGEARKLLCNSCNWRIGMLETADPNWMKRAMNYIKGE